MNSSYSVQTAKQILKGHSMPHKPYVENIEGIANFAHLFEQRVAANPTKEFLTYLNKEGESSTYTYGQFYDRVCAMANLLLTEFDVQLNDRVSSVAYNHSDTVALMFACWMVGACYVPINVGEDDERLLFIHNNAQVKIMFVMPEYTARITALKSKFDTVKNYLQMNGDDVKGFESLTEMLAGTSHEFINGNATLASDALLVYTSGTTGTPKGVLLQQYSCIIDAMEIAKWYGFTAADKAMLILPMHHVNGIIVTLLTPLYFGGSIVLNEKFSASHYWRIIQDQGCTYGSVVPTVLSFLCEADNEVNTAPLKKMQHDKAGLAYFVICGAGPLTVESAKRFDEALNVKVNHGYGLSETTCYSCFLPFDLNQADYQKWMRSFGYPSIGVPLPCNEMDIHEANGCSVPEGEKGEIVIRGHNIMRCYDKRPDANAEAFEFGWFKSGDEGFYKLDEKGRKFFFITGRLKELIIRGGVNYSPLEIDEAINKIKGVKAGMAVGFENNMYGEEVGAYVVLEAGAALCEKQILKSLEVLPFSKRPKVVLIGDSLPVTSTGKYQRNKLKHLFKKWDDTQFRE
ncbi:MAG: long-chain acyl-CoA synthetase [Alphaproteobacteria bacterium]|jgi:long-chain acyl-CoA synthetase